METTYQLYDLFVLMGHLLHMISTFVGIIKDTLKLFPSNSKFLLIIAILTSSINSILFLLTVFSIRPSIIDLIAKTPLLPITGPEKPEFISLLLSIKEDIRILFGVEWIFVIIQFISAAFVATTIILATSYLLACHQKAMSLKELLLKAIKAMKRPLLTRFYTTLLSCVYNMVVFIVLLILMFLLIDSPFKPLSVVSVFTLIVTVLYAYLSVVWTLSVVVSVIEEKSGIEALGKAYVIIKGFKLDGFMINLVFMIVGYGFFEGLRFLLSHLFRGNNSVGILIGLVVVNFFSSLANMFLLMTFTVLYYKCEENHRDEFELQGRSEYVKVPTTPMIIAEDMA